MMTLLFQPASNQYVLSSFRRIARVIVKVRLYIPPLQFVFEPLARLPRLMRPPCARSDGGFNRSANSLTRKLR